MTLLISNPSGSGASINGFTLGSVSCVFQNNPIPIPAGTQGLEIQIQIPVSNGVFGSSSSSWSAYATIISSSSSSSSSSSGSSSSSTTNQYTATCTGTQAAQVGIQYSGYITTVSGQTYPFTVTASS